MQNQEGEEERFEKSGGISELDAPEYEPSEASGGPRVAWWKAGVVLVLIAAVLVVLALKNAGSAAPPQEPPEAAEAPSPPEPETYEVEADTVLATVNGQDIMLAELNRVLEGAPEQVRTRFENRPHMLLDQLVQHELLIQQAGQADPAAVQELLEREVFSEVEVTDDDLRALYEENRDKLPEGATFEATEEQLRPIARRQKQAVALQAYLGQLLSEADVELNQQWVRAQMTRAADNPLDRALATGRPVLADFGRGTCIPCKMMKPILDALKEEYAGRAEILIIQIDDYPAVTQRVGIGAIPTQIFYDAEGEEVHRHQGFMPRDAMVEKLAEMGVE